MGIKEFNLNWAENMMLLKRIIAAGISPTVLITVYDDTTRGVQLTDTFNQYSESTEIGVPYAAPSVVDFYKSKYWSNDMYEKYQSTNSYYYSLYCKGYVAHTKRGVSYPEVEYVKDQLQVADEATRLCLYGGTNVSVLVDLIKGNQADATTAEQNSFLTYISMIADTAVSVLPTSLIANFCLAYTARYNVRSIFTTIYQTLYGYRPGI